MVDYVADFRDHFAQVQAHLSGVQSSQLPPSFVTPNGFWRSAEKDKFFHGLTLYSRLRPDLISAHIGTKSVVDVCAYIDILEQETALMQKKHFCRDALEGAMEVSARFMKWEDEEASELAASETQWAKKGKEDLIERNEKDYALRSLDVHQLKVMEGMLREAEYAAGERLSGLGVCENEEQSQQLSGTISLPQLDMNIDEGSLGLESLTAQSDTTPEATHGTEVNRATVHDTKNNPVPIGKATGPPMMELSLASQRRQRKRMYMRQKRAKLRGKEVNLTTERLRPGRKQKEVQINQQPEVMAESQHDLETTGENDIEEQLSTNGSPAQSPLQEQAARRTHKGGVTRPYKIREAFQELGITAETLNDRGLGFFHLSALKRMMQSRNAVARAISTDTIQLMRDILVGFTTEVVHRSVISREQEQVIKGDIKVWRTCDEINVGHVEHALEMMGLDTLPLSSQTISMDQDFIPEDDGEDENLADAYDGIAISAPASEMILHRQVHGPLVVLPRCYLAPSAFSSANKSNEGGLMPLEIDEGAILQELQEEEDLDEEDLANAAAYEADFWERFKSI